MNEKQVQEYYGGNLMMKIIGITNDFMIDIDKNIIQHKCDTVGAFSWSLLCGVTSNGHIEPLGIHVGQGKKYNYGILFDHSFLNNARQ